MLGMVLRRDVASCVKVVGILAVDSDLENSRLLLMKFGNDETGVMSVFIAFDMMT